MALSTELVGREPELTVLRSCLDAALEGFRRVVVCTGEPGIGKTRLAEELLTLAADRGARGVWGGAVEAAGAPPFWPWRQVLRTLAASEDLTAIADEQQLTEDLARLAPDVFRAAHGDGNPAGSADERFRQFDAMGLLLTQLTRRRPLVIVLDDAHWADEASLLLLQHVAQTVREQRLLILVNSRDTENGHSGLLAELMREPGTRQLRLAGLERSDVGSRLSALLGRAVPEADAARVHAVTGGNPFFVDEVGRTLGSGSSAGAVSWSLREAIGGRIARLPVESAELLRAASVVGREFSPTVVAAMLGLPTLHVVARLDAAAAAGLVEAPATAGRLYRFTHALVRDVVEAALSGPDRIGLHRRAALALEELHGEPPGPHLFDLARHWSVAAVAGERSRAVGWIERAAAQAWQHGAYEEAARLLRLALDVGADELDAEARCRLLLALAASLHATGDLPGQLAACQQAAVVAEDLNRPDLLAEAALETEPTFFLPEIDVISRRLCERALALLDPAGPALHARVLARQAELCMSLGDDRTAGTASLQALSLAEQAGDATALSAALHARQEVCSGPDDLEERAQLAERMLAVAGSPGSPRLALLGHLARVDAALERGDLALVGRELEAASRCADQVRGRLARWLLLRSQSVHAQAQARFADARRLATEAFRTVAPLGQPSAPIVWSGFLSTNAHHVGYDAESLAAQGFLDGDQLDFPTAGVIRALAPALVLADIGRVGEAAAIYRSLGPVAEWRPTPHAILFSYAFGISLAVRLGATDDVAVLHDRLAPYRGHHVVSGVCSIAYFGPVELWLGVAAAHLDVLDDAVADLEHAAKACAVSGAAGFHAEAQFELARVLARRAGPGDLGRARRLTAEAARQAEALGMPPIAQKAAQLRSSIESATAELPLTPREREVAELVAQGLTNRQIADRLFLSERTAQNHVQHILDKLDLPNRSQIAVLITSGR